MARILYFRNNFQAGNTIQTGKAEGQLGIAIVPEGQFGALTFTVSMDKIIVADSANKRLNIYDHNLVYIKTIKNTQNNKVGFAERIIYSKDKMLYFKHDYGLTLIDENGDILLHKNARELPNEVVHRYNAFLLDNEIYFYNDNLRLQYLNMNEVVNSIDKILVKLKNVEQGQNRNLNLTDTLQLPEKMLFKIQDIQAEGKFLIIGDKFFSTNVKQHQEYYMRIESIRDQVKSLRTHNNAFLQKNESTQRPIEIDDDTCSSHFVGYDDTHNSYWQFESKKETDNIIKQVIVVYSKFGELLDAFQYGVLSNYEPNLEQYHTSGAKVAVAPNGDVWFMQGSAKGHFFYKIPRVW